MISGISAVIAPIVTIRPENQLQADPIVMWSNMHDPINVIVLVMMFVGAAYFLRWCLND